jgi:HK97 family phage major capsid protein
MAKRRKVTEIEADLEVQRSISLEVEGMDAPSDEDIQRGDAALDRFESLQSELADAQAYEDRIEAMRSASLTEGATEGGDQARTGEVRRSRGPEVMTQVDPFELLRSNNRDMGAAEYTEALRSSNLKAIESAEMPDGYTGSFEKLINRHRRDASWGQNLLARQRPEYISAFEKAVTGREILLSDVERAAIAVGTNTAGGYLVPTQLDPTLILTNAGAKDVVRTLSRQVTLTGGANKWNGVTTAGATASWDAELTEVSDDTPPVAPAQVPVYSAKALIMASIESFEDITGLTSDVQMLLADARTRLEAAAHMTGTGSGQPTGIFPALSGNGAVTISLATGHTWTLTDLQAVALSLGDRWTDSSEWLMHPKFLGEIQALGTALGATYSTDITQPFTQQILGHKVNQSFIAPSTSQTTTIDNLAVFGDFSNYLIVDKPGSTSVEFIPHFFNTSNNLPDGRRGWYMHFRNGADSINDLAFRLLVDKTTA